VCRKSRRGTKENGEKEQAIERMTEFISIFGEFVFKREELLHVLPSRTKER